LSDGGQAAGRPRGGRLAYVVASPRLLDTERRTTEQMKLVNALCRFAELAEPLPV
jgi:hypothetical protein